MKINNQTINHLVKFLMMFTFVIMLASCAAISGRETAGEYVDDAAITTKVKTAILNEPSLSSFEIRVETFQKVVQLSGFVDSPKAAAKAKQLASKIKGVQKVKNDIVIRKSEK